MSNSETQKLTYFIIFFSILLVAGTTLAEKSLVKNSDIRIVYHSQHQ